MIVVLDALRELLKQYDPAIDFDDAMSQPYEWRENTVYSWAETVDDVPIGTGEVRTDFEILMVYAVGNEGEEAISERSRDVSVKLDTARQAWMDLIRANANAGPWSNLRARAEQDFLRQLEVRGVGIRISGYRIGD
jgi:hypothetical protein